MRRIFQKYKLLFLLGILFLALSFPIQGQAAARSFSSASTITGKTKVTINWKKKSVSGYDIYRAPSDADGNTGKYKKIATISGKKKSYTDKVKYKKHYSYKIKGYRKKGSKKIYKYESACSAYTGVGAANWEEYLFSDAEVTPESIRVAFCTYEGMKPDGFIIYRRLGPMAFRKITRIETKNGYVSYTDTDVFPGATYTYKARAYKKTGKKTIYGKYCEPISLSAVNQSGKYQVQPLTPDNQTASSITLALTSDEYNADTIFSDYQFMSEQYCYADQDKYQYTDLGIDSYSLDNQTWISFKNKEVVLKPGKTIYLRLTSEDRKPFWYTISGSASSAITHMDIAYNNLSALLDIDFKTNTAKSYANGEMYH